MRSKSYLCSSFHPRQALPPSGSPVVLSHCSAATNSPQNSDNPAGRSLRGCLRVSAVHCIRGGPCPLGLPCGSISSPSRHGCSSGSDNPAGRSLRGCLRVSAVHCIRGGPCPLGLPCGSISSPSRHGCSSGSDNPAGRSLRGCLRVSAVHCIRGGPCPLGLPCGSISSPSRHGCSSGSDNPAGRSLRGCLSMTLQAQQSVFLNWDAGELRLGQITPTALPSSRQTAS